MSVFAALWWVLGLRASGHAAWPLVALGPLLTAVIVVLAARRKGPAPGPDSARIGRVVGIASGVEGFLIFLVANLLINTGRSAFLAPAVAIIVGLHFWPLARWIPARSYYWTGGLLVILGLIGIAIPKVEVRILVVCAGAACLLWLTCLGVLRRTAVEGAAV